MKLIFEDYLGEKTAIEVICVRHQTDAKNRPIDIAVMSFNQDELEEIAEVFGELGFNCRRVELSEVREVFRYGLPEGVLRKWSDGNPIYEALYGRLSKFTVENPMGGVVYN